MSKLTAVAVGVAVLAAPGVASAAGSWSSNVAGTGTGKAAKVQPAVTATGTAKSLTSVTISVTAGPTSGAPVTGYRVDRVTAPAMTGACYISASTGSCDAAAVGGVQNDYNVVSYVGVLGPSTAPSAVYWTSLPKSVQATPVLPDTAGPTITATCPANTTPATSYSRGNSGTWVTLCGEKITVTATDVSGISSVQISVREGTTSGNYYGTNFNEANEIKHTATAGAAGTYSIPLTVNRLSAAKTYTVTVYATDGVTPTGNASSLSYTFKTP